MGLAPEDQARTSIDALLAAAGWVVQDRADFNRNAAEGVAVREFTLPSGPCDYLLLVGGKACGVIEAKKAGVTLSGVAEQSARCMAALPEHLARWADQLVFDYESTGDETCFRDMRDPKPRSRRVFACHQPQTLHAWLKEPDTLRARLRRMPPLETTGLRDCQIDATTGLETSLADDRPRALIQRATGAGKTFTACNFSWRLLKAAGARRIMFLVDRNNLGDQTLREYQNFDPAGAAHKFDRTYIVQHLHGNRIDPDAKLVITTIQRLYAMLRGEELDEAAEEASAFETWSGTQVDAAGELRPVTYNPALPIEHFDFIVTDECHRSIYGLWRQVLEYFDGHAIGAHAGLLPAQPGGRVPLRTIGGGRRERRLRGLSHPHPRRRTGRHGRCELTRAGARPPQARAALQATRRRPALCQARARQFSDRARSDPPGAADLSQQAVHRAVPGPQRPMGAEDADLRQGRPPCGRDRQGLLGSVRPGQ